VYDKHYNTNKRKVQKGEEIAVLRNCALGILDGSIKSIDTTTMKKCVVIIYYILCVLLVRQLS